MCFVYAVRCRFTEPARETAWNAWYSGPKIADMLAKPHFITCQRFRRSAGVGRDYLALWTLRSPEAFKTREYTSDWGFFEWERYITDWSRDLFDAGDTPETAFAVPESGTLRLVSFDGMSAEDARATAARPEFKQTALMWLTVVGLDRHTPIMGLRPETAEAAVSNDIEGVQAAIYRPICPLQRTFR